MFDPNRAGMSGEPGMLEGLKSFFAVLSSIVHTRLDLFVTELEEERERLRQILILTLLLFFGLSFGSILLTIFIVALLWEHGWIAALGCLSLVYLGVGIMAAIKLRSTFLTRPGLFRATLQELGKDRDRLRASTFE